jgi:hypothetical protein
VFFHPFEELQRPGPMEQKILVHHEEGADSEACLHLLHHFKQFIACLVKVDELPLAAEKRRRSAEVAAQRTPHGRNDRRCCTTPFFGQAQSQDACLHAGDDFRMSHRTLKILTEIPAHPRYALALHEMVGVDAVFDAGKCRDVAADNQN